MTNHIKLHNEEQGTEAWHLLRCGLLTASQVSKIVTPKLKIAKNDKTKAIIHRLAIQRITGIPEETFTSDKMLRGHIDEDYAVNIYHNKYSHVELVGFITNSNFPHLGYSPDGVVGVEGLIEIKSRDPHLQFSTIINRENGDGIPDEYMAQVQTGLMISERKWCDFISFSHGLPMMVHRVYPDIKYQKLIKEATDEVQLTVDSLIKQYTNAIENKEIYTPTERIDYEGMIL